MGLRRPHVQAYLTTSGPMMCAILGLINEINGIIIYSSIIMVRWNISVSWGHAL